MSPARFRQIRNLFEAVLEQPARERETFLREACRGDEDLCAEVEHLLEARDGLAWLDRPADPARTDPHSLEGRRIGPYQVLRELGQGGMGTVYLGARADHAFNKQVAIKIVHAGFASAELIARFEQEREILASLDHPHIARLLDGGTTSDGLSYLVMEYVEGSRLDQYCDDHKLDIAARLALFRTVCAAVEYAHTRRVIHRDLKPANILVTAGGVVKLLDFGIAKLLPDSTREATALATRTGLMLMTPEYASPEQVRGEAAGAATDVYALGVVLYQLLTGRMPYQLHSRLFHEVVRVVSEEQPVRPSAAVTKASTDHTVPTTAQIGRLRQASPSELSRSLAGDLDGILLKTLEKDPRDRYGSPAQLSDEIERHLEGRPVEARQASPGYRVGKFMVRNLPWAILAAALVAALVSGGITIHWQGGVAIVACLLAVGLWYASTNRAIGRRIAESDFLYTYVPPRAMLASLIILALQIMHAASRDGVNTRPLLLFFALLSPVAIRQLYGWLTRRRNAGALVLNLTCRWYLLAAVRIAAILPLLVWSVKKVRLPAYCYLGYVAAGIMVWLHGCLEIRSRGIVYLGSLYLWESIESYEWREFNEFGARKQSLISLGISKAKSISENQDMLYLHLRRSIHFLPPARVPVPDGRREEIDRLMHQYLSEWPSARESVPTE